MNQDQAADRGRADYSPWSNGDGEAKREAGRRSQPSRARRQADATVSTRDRAVVELVGTFRQMLPRQIGAVLFASRASKTPLDRSLRRLYERGYLARLSMRAVGGHGGGSGQYVYQLGRAGWRLLGIPGTYWVQRAVSLHTLEIAEVYVALKALEHEGQVELLRFDREQEGWQKAQGVQLTPDAVIELGLPAIARKVSYFVEVDRGTEKANVLREKCSRYWWAYNHWSEETFPYVLFVTPDQQRKQEIAAIVEGGPQSARAIFQVCTQAELRSFAVLSGAPVDDPEEDRTKQLSSEESADEARLSSSAPFSVWIDPHTMHVKISLIDP